MLNKPLFSSVLSHLFRLILCLLIHHVILSFLIQITSCKTICFPAIWASHCFVFPIMHFSILITEFFICCFILLVAERTVPFYFHWCRDDTYICTFHSLPAFNAHIVQERTTFLHCNSFLASADSQHSHPQISQNVKRHSLFWGSGTLSTSGIHKYIFSISFTSFYNLRNIQPDSFLSSCIF